jgi:hypothetical protein
MSNRPKGEIFAQSVQSFLRQSSPKCSKKSPLMSNRPKGEIFAQSVQPWSTVCCQRVIFYAYIYVCIKQVHVLKVREGKNQMAVKNIFYVNLLLDSRLVEKFSFSFEAN